MVRGVCFREKVGWPVFWLVGDTMSVLEQVLSFRVKSGLRRQNRHLRCLFYVWRRLQATMFFVWTLGGLNPADCFSRMASNCSGDFNRAEASGKGRPIL